MIFTVGWFLEININALTAFYSVCLLKLKGFMVETGISFSLSSCEFCRVNFTHADLEQRWRA